jgi:hypothetical protein
MNIGLSHDSTMAADMDERHSLCLFSLKLGSIAHRLMRSYSSLCSSKLSGVPFLRTYMNRHILFGIKRRGIIPSLIFNTSYKKTLMTMAKRDIWQNKIEKDITCYGKL